ncbi:unnamed protein product [Schistosoma haematobium]|nr:unnamed protein product [Schistosoma haematobium]CAH8611188.1 unnamed protein product [Schistosoma haematobium]
MIILYVATLLFILYFLCLPSSDASHLLCVLGFTSFCPNWKDILLSYFNHTILYSLLKSSIF